MRRAQLVDGGPHAAPAFGRLPVALAFGLLHLACRLGLGLVAVRIEQLAGEFDDLRGLHRFGPPVALAPSV